MKSTVNRELLVYALGKVTSIIDNKTPMPIMNGVKINIANGVASFYAANGHESWMTSIEADGELQVVVPAKKLFEVAKAAKSESAIFESTKTDSIVCKFDRSKFTLSSFDYNTYPERGLNNDFVQLKLNPKEFLSIINSVHPAAGVNDVRPFLNGVLLEISKGSIIAVATNGHQLASSKIKVKNNAESICGILPNSCIDEIRKTLQKIEDDSIIIEISTRDFRMVTADSEYYSNLINATFPDWRKVIPQIKNMDKKAILDSSDLISSIKMAKAAGFFNVALSFDKNKISLHAENNSEQIIDEIDVEYSGNPLDIVFNINYAVNMVDSLSSDKIEIHMKDNKMPVVCIQSGANTSEFVLMPVVI